MKAVRITRSRNPQLRDPQSLAWPGRTPARRSLRSATGRKERGGRLGGNPEACCSRRHRSAESVVSAGTVLLSIRYGVGLTERGGGLIEGWKGTVRWSHKSQCRCAQFIRTKRNQVGETNASGEEIQNLAFPANFHRSKTARDDIFETSFPL